MHWCDLHALLLIEVLFYGGREIHCCCKENVWYDIHTLLFLQEQLGETCCILEVVWQDLFMLVTEMPGQKINRMHLSVTLNTQIMLLFINRNFILEVKAHKNYISRFSQYLEIFYVKSSYKKSPLQLDVWL